jgi:hypothetical protein
MAKAMERLLMSWLLLFTWSFSIGRVGGGVRAQSLSSLPECGVCPRVFGPLPPPLALSLGRTHHLTSLAIMHNKRPGPL